LEQGVGQERRILLTGAPGLLGSYLLDRLAKYYTLLGASARDPDQPYVSINYFDVSHIRQLLENYRIDYVIHCCALTNVDQCESDPGLAYQLNVQTTQNIADAINQLKTVGLLYISTDQMYSGGNSNEDNPNPNNVYSITKLMGESAALSVTNSLIFRTNFYGWGHKKPSFSDWIIQSYRSGKPFTLFDDVVFSPLNMADLSDLIKKAFDKKLNGVYNAGSSDSCSKQQFGFEIAKALGLSNSNLTISQSKHFNFKARRPLDMSMNSEN
jgi:dTDP-4-dehydrorhamnose reductase